MTLMRTVVFFLLLAITSQSYALLPPLRQIDGRAALRVPARPVLGVHLAHQPPRVHVALLWERVLPPKNQLDVLLEIKRVEGRLEALRKRMKRRPRRRVRQGSFHIPHARVCGD